MRYQMKGYFKAGYSFISHSMKTKEKRSAYKPDFDKEAELRNMGKRIKSIRLQKGYTSYEVFAYEHNISRAQFGRYENGEDLRYSSLVRIIRAFDMSIDEFFSEGFD